MNAITNRHQSELTDALGTVESIAVAYAICGSLIANVVGDDPKKVAEMIELHATHYADSLRARTSLHGETRN